MGAPIALGKKLTNIEVSSFCGQMALILKSGISSLEGLEIMKEDSTNKSEIALLDYLIEETRLSGSLKEAVQSCNLFPAYVVHMLEIGEETGTMDEVMDSLEKHYLREHNVSHNIRSSLTFPLIMIGMMIVVIVVLLTVVLPIFNRVFLQLGTEMTGISGAMLGLGNSMRNYSLVFIIAAAVILLLILSGIFTAKGRGIIRKISNVFPSIRKINDENAACRIASVLGMTLRSGLTQNRCVELADMVNTNPDYKEKLKNVSKMLEEGEDLSKSLSKNGIFTGLYSRLSLIGEKTGSIDNTMNQIADMYQESIDTRMSNIISVIEPALVVILSVIVGIILLSVMLPLMGIMSGM